MSGNFLGAVELGDDRETLDREILSRLAKLETKIDIFMSQCPACQAKIGSHDIALAKVDESAKSAHKRIDEQGGEFKKRIDDIYRNAAFLGAGVAGVLELLFRVMGK